MNIKSILALLIAAMFLVATTQVATAVPGPNRGPGLGVMEEVEEEEVEEVEEVELEEMEVEEIELDELDVLKII